MSKTAKSKTFLASDESINCYGLRILTDGIDTTAFESNPVMLYMHQRGKVFGSWENLTKKDGKFYADAVFDLDDPDEVVQSVAGKVERGHIRACSIGIEPDWSKVVRNDDLNCYDCPVSVLTEISIVDIGGNRNALKLYRNGELLGDDIKLSAVLEEYKPIETNTPQTVQTMNLAAIATALGLAATATEQDVQGAIINLKAESGYKEKFEQLQAAVTKAKKDDAVKLVDAAVADKRITAAQKEDYLALFDLNFDLTAKTLASLTKPQDLVQLANQGAAATATTVALPDAKAKEDWDAHDKAGTLIQLKAKQPEEYARLFEAKFGRKPTA
ncbi:hypothetical protein DYU11_18455 [Fibrisoma montanum]|uniref:Prohead serine protease domain-containing protein n=1 Tax=Fibrisoma montanum TaxID=2305895 RepID=A0A418M618_9BACT|nr:HK97 family phage prohead protease [Fibrisoma montanum]RIV21388.1 hypothetical protein DYU11_18455 [Fibrisoma montanum]